MESNSIMFTFFLCALILIASPIDGRKEPGEYWRQVMKDQPMPEPIKVFMQERYPNNNNVGNENELKSYEKTKDKSIIKKLDAIPNISAYHDDGITKKLVSPINGRKDPGEYWGQVMKGQPIPEAIKVFIHKDHNNVGKDNGVENYKDDYATILMIINSNSRPKKLFVDDFEPRPSATSYLDDTNPTQGSEKFVDEFEPRPSVTSYHDDTKPTKGSKNFVNDFEPRPSVTSYRDDTKPTKGSKMFVDDFEPRPSVTAYLDDTNPIKGSKKAFVDDFEPRPSVTAYNN